MVNIAPKTRPTVRPRPVSCALQGRKGAGVDCWRGVASAGCLVHGWTCPIQSTNRPAALKFQAAISSAGRDEPYPCRPTKMIFFVSRSAFEAADEHGESVLSLKSLLRAP
eukprot:1158729-Pelagomonas_calceolata.AAC.7